MELFKIECIGEGSPRSRPYGVWEILGIDGNEGIFKKTPVRPQKDYAKANSVGTRGIYAYYLLKSERIYEILKPVSWNGTDHFFAYLDVNELIRLDTEGVFTWLKNRSA